MRAQVAGVGAGVGMGVYTFRVNDSGPARGGGRRTASIGPDCDYMTLFIPASRSPYGSHARMRLHEFVTVTSGGHQSPGSTLIHHIISVVAFGGDVLQTLCTIGAVCPIWDLTHTKNRARHMDAVRDTAGDSLECHPPGEHADNSLRQS